ncbi:GAF domain-containing protein [Actinoplanes octamycinicus]|uniref:GAF domain-containing protein n=1 Tax=Actinoplanes octamycinicus TaxID=135948 RepID=A0A7W7H4Z6_9ACTN|nr:GAF domain-containing protein [Actinoplanes octamycinicus]MBB4743909.1 GAF domain-containing protein [Actinoplanes octamycinicus]GIE58536.1 hypothetical protein Aoc01nite_39380 [Actinoplanes octamycinicus]
MTLPAALADIGRLTEVAQYHWDDPRLRARLDEITARTADQLQVPVSLVSIMLDSAEYIAGATGLPDSITEVGGLPAEWSFCTQVVATGRPYLVTDATTDPAWMTNPAVTVYGARSYAGVPLLAPNGQILGAHCAVGTDTRAFNETDVSTLHTAAQEILALLRQHRNNE